MKNMENKKINVALKKWCLDSQFVNHKLQIFIKKSNKLFN